MGFNIDDQLWDEFVEKYIQSDIDKFNFPDSHNYNDTLFKMMSKTLSCDQVKFDQVVSEDLCNAVDHINALIDGYGKNYDMALLRKNGKPTLYYILWAIYHLNTNYAKVSVAYVLRKRIIKMMESAMFAFTISENEYWYSVMYACGENHDPRAHIRVAVLLERMLLGIVQGCVDYSTQSLHILLFMSMFTGTGKFINTPRFRIQTNAMLIETWRSKIHAIQPRMRTTINNTIDDLGKKLVDDNNIDVIPTYSGLATIWLLRTVSQRLFWYRDENLKIHTDICLRASRMYLNLLEKTNEATCERAKP